MAKRKFRQEIRELEDRVADKDKVIAELKQAINGEAEVHTETELAAHKDLSYEQGFIEASSRWKNKAQPYLIQLSHLFALIPIWGKGTVYFERSLVHIRSSYFELAASKLLHCVRVGLHLSRPSQQPD